MARLSLAKLERHLFSAADILRSKMDAAEYKDFKRFFLQNSKQSTNLASINSTQIEAFPVLLPGLIEKDTIMSRLCDFDFSLENERSELTKLMALKQGLSDDLLTGRVRVPAELDLA